MGSENPLVSLSAYTTQLQEHLPPVDTIDATAKAKMARQERYLFHFEPPSVAASGQLRVRMA